MPWKLESLIPKKVSFFQLPLNPFSVLLLFTFISYTVAYVRYGHEGNKVRGLFSYMLHVRVKLDDVPGKSLHTQCGGTMITPGIVYTACHCFFHDGHVHTAGHVEVYSYMSHFNGRKEGKKLFKFKKVWLPSEGCMADNGGVHSETDYALIFLDDNYNIGIPKHPEFNICESEQGPIILLIPPNSTEVNADLLLAHPENCFLAGFGWSEQPKHDNQLRYIHAKTIEHKNSERNDFTVGFEFNDDGKASGACPGDSGSPFVCVHGDKPYVLGVVSGGLERDGQIVPGDLNKGHINCQNRADQTYFSKMEYHYKKLLDAIAREKPNGLHDLDHWQKKCSKYYEKVGYSTRNLTAYNMVIESTSPSTFSSMTSFFSIVFYVFFNFTL